MKKIVSITLSLLLGLSLQARGEFEIIGLSGITVKVSSLKVARDYYEGFLGFDEAFHYPDGPATVLAFKVNDRQFIQVVEDRNVVPGDALVKVSILVESADDAHDSLRAKGWTVGDVAVDGAGEKAFTCLDADGNTVEFIEYQAGGKHLKCAGKKLSRDRVSDRIAHVGLPSSGVDSSDPFWVGVLGCREILKESRNGRSIHYLRLGPSLESIEHYSPCKPDFAHPCLQTMDLQATLDLLRSRQGGGSMGKPGIGMTRRWVCNITNPDGTRVEFTEPFCVR